MTELEDRQCKLWAARWLLRGVLDDAPASVAQNLEIAMAHLETAYIAEFDTSSAPLTWPLPRTAEEANTALSINYGRIEELAAKVEDLHAELMEVKEERDRYGD